VVSDPAFVSTYCNPLPLPHYQRGRACAKPGYEGPDFREMADPTVIRFEGQWYLFPSAGLLWRSADMVHWEHIPIEPFDPGYAPTVVVHRGWLYLTASWDCSAIWRARSPLGPWERLGTRAYDADGNETWLKDHTGKPVRWGDPCLFSDEDGSLYCYCNLGQEVEPSPAHPWRITNDIGILGVRLDAEDPSRFAEAPVKLVNFRPEHWWERGGESNHRLDAPVLEGAWMTRHGGRYFLQYSANGTEYRNYAIGCYVSDHPLGPFEPQRRNPVLIHRGGLVNGCAHHSVVEGPDGGLWCFYTTLVRIAHPYERRIAMDRVAFDENGELYIEGPTETPQPVPGGETGEPLVALSVNCPARASSVREGRSPHYAVDDGIRTWWEASSEEAPQWLEVDLEAAFPVAAVRILFADRGLDYAAGCRPAPYQYRIHGSLDGSQWSVLADLSGNEEERHIAYHTWAPVPARHVRLEILALPPGMTAAVWEFTVFGRPHEAGFSSAQ